VILLAVLSTLLSVALRYAKQHYLKAIRPLFVFSIRIKPISDQTQRMPSVSLKTATRFG
jgi:hypothetical protein